LGTGILASDIPFRIAAVVVMCLNNYVQVDQVQTGIYTLEVVDPGT
jgi:hypothetical protein